MAYSLSGISDLGVAITETPRKSANLDIFTLPLSNSNEAMAWDFNGAQMEITLTGKMIGTSVSDLATKVQPLLNAINGNQSIRSYHSDLIGTVNVKIDSVDIQYDSTGTGPVMATYTLRLIESSDV